MTNQEIIDVISKAEYNENGGCVNVMIAHKGKDDYKDTIKPHWDFYDYDYRIKPKKRIVELTKEDLDERIRNNQTLTIIQNEDIVNWQWYNESGIRFCYDATITSYSNLKKFKWADGTNCYKEIEE